MKHLLILLTFLSLSAFAISDSEKALQSVLKNKGDAVVLFYSSENAYAAELAGMLQMMGLRYFGFNVQSHPALTHGWGVKSTPFLFFVEDGQKQSLGFVPLDEAEEVLD